MGLVQTWQKLRFLKAVFTTIKNPYETAEIDRTSAIFATEESMSFVFNRIRADEKAASLFDARTPPPRIDLRTLRQLPLGTFGRALADHLDRNNLDPELFPKRGADAVAWTRNRFRQTHDIWHVVAGYDVTLEDEFGLQAFGFAQLAGAGSALICAIGILHGIFFNRALLPATFEKIVDGYRRGKSAAFLFGQDWESMYERPLIEVRRELRLSSFRG